MEKKIIRSFFFNLIPNEKIYFFWDIYLILLMNGVKDIIDIHQDMIISIVDLFKKKGIATLQEFNETMQERIIKNSLFT